MRIELWTDIICPWCGLGAHQLDTALARFGHAEDIELVHRSFELDASAPVGETQTVREMLRKKMRASDAQIEAMTGRVEQMAAAAGLAPYVVLENRVGNTSLAHELAAWATELGHGKAVWAALYKAYFGEARSIFDVDALVALASELGLDAAHAREVLTSRRYAAAVKEDGNEARALGSNGVPFIVIDRKYGVSGAQPVEALLQALEQAWRNRPAGDEAKQQAASDDASSDTTCGPDGCEVPAQG